jgi:hypothetical protein
MAPSDQQVRTLWMDPSVSRRAAAARLGCSTVTLRLRAKALGLPMRVPVDQLVEPVPDTKVRELWLRDDLTRPEQARLAGITPGALFRRAQALGLPMREPVSAGKKPLSDRRVRALWLRDDLSRAEQAALAGIAVSALQERANKLGLPMRRAVRDRRIPADRIREVWLDPHLSGQQAADAVGLTRTNLWRRAKALGLPARKPGTRFSLIGDQQARFLEMWEAPVIAAEIAEHFGIHVMTVCAYARRLGGSKRTHPSRLIPLSEFWDRRRHERLNAVLMAAARDAARAQLRYKAEDFDAEPGDETQEKRIAKARPWRTLPAT